MPMAQKGLAKLIEECGELIQEAAKAEGMNLDIDKPHWDGKGPLRERMENEMGDVIAAINFVCRKFDLNTFNIHYRTLQKEQTFEQFDKSED